MTPAAADDPFLARLLRHGTGLRAGGPEGGPHEVVATYWTSGGEAAFAFCRHGLLLWPGRQQRRYVPYEEVEDAGYYNVSMVQRAKTARVTGVSEPLTVTLRGGERVDLPVEVRGDGMPDLLTIAGLIQQQVVIHQAERRREGS